MSTKVAIPARPQLLTVADFERAIHEGSEGTDKLQIAWIEQAFAAKSRFMPAYTASNLRARLKSLQSRCLNASVTNEAETVQYIDAKVPVNRPTPNIAILQAPQTEGIVSIADKSNATIQLYGVHSTLHIRNIKDCKVFVGPCSGAVFLTNVDACHVHLAAHQIRLAQCSATKLFVHVSTLVNLEDCKDITVGPVEAWYESFSDDMRIAGLTGPNRLDQIVNFTDL